MKTLKLTGLALVCAGLATTADAAPKAISTIGSALVPATTYSFFTVQTLPAGVTQLTVRNMVQSELNASTALPKLTACWVSGDSNITSVNCDNGAMQFGNADLYTYNGASIIPAFPLSKTEVVGLDPKKSDPLNKLILTSKGANFRVGTVGVPNSGDATGRVVNIHFNQRVAQFGMLVDSGQVDAASISGIQFIVNRQTTPIQSLPAGAATFVGVEDSAGFTDVSIIASGDVNTQSNSRSWIADHFSFVPLAKF